MKHPGSETPSHLLLGRQSAKLGGDSLLTNRERALVRLALAGGAALAVIGTTDVALLWIPPYFGNAEWEFATISATLESLPLAAVGFGLLAAGALLRRGRVALYLLTAVFVLLALIVAGSAALFALDIPLALRGAPAQLKGQLTQHFIKTGLLTLAYLTLFVYLAILTFSNARPRRSGA